MQAPSISVLYEYFCLQIFTLQPVLSAILIALPGAAYNLADYSFSAPQGVCQAVVSVQLGGTGGALGIH